MSVSTSGELLRESPEVERWFGSKGRTDDEELCTAEEVAALKDFLVRKNGQKPLAAQETAVQLMTVPEGRDDMADPSSKAFRIAQLIIDAQLDFEAQQNLTLDLIDAINAITESGGIDEELKQTLHDVSWECCTETTDKWNTLASDMWRSCWAWRYQSIEDEPAELPLRHWNAVNALFANRTSRRLTTALSEEGSDAVIKIGLGDIATIGLNQICEALEQEPWKRMPKEPPSGPGSKQYTVQNLDIEVPPAARWLQITGHFILEWIRRSGDTAIPHATGSTDLWKVDEHHPAGFSLARWALWKQRLRWVAEEVSGAELSQETRNQARLSLATMEELESQT